MHLQPEHAETLPQLYTFLGALPSLLDLSSYQVFSHLTWTYHDIFILTFGIFGLGYCKPEPLLAGAVGGSGNSNTWHSQFWRITLARHGRKSWQVALRNIEVEKLLEEPHYSPSGCVSSSHPSKVRQLKSCSCNSAVPTLFRPLCVACSGVPIVLLPRSVMCNWAWSWALLERFLAMSGLHCKVLFHCLGSLLALIMLKLKPFSLLMNSNAAECSFSSSGTKNAAGEEAAVKWDQDLTVHGFGIRHYGVYQNLI